MKWSKVVSDFEFDSEEEMMKYFENGGYISDGLSVDDMADDLLKALIIIKSLTRKGSNT